MTRPRQVVLVVGPSRAGVTSLVAALRERMPEQSIVEAGDGGAGDSPAVVVAVVSAVAPMTESDCATVDMVAAGVDAVVGVVAKIDAHRGWRDVLTANRLALGAHASRYRTMPWVGVAAAPDVGDPNVDELVPAELPFELPCRAFPRRYGSLPVALPHSKRERSHHLRPSPFVAHQVSRQSNTISSFWTGRFVPVCRCARRGTVFAPHCRRTPPIGHRR